MAHDVDPEYRVRDIRPKRRVQRTRHFAPGELPRLVLDALRTAPEPLATREVTRRVMAAKALDAGDARLLEAVDKCVGGYLRRRAAGLVECVANGGGRPLWRVA